MKGYRLQYLDFFKKSLPVVVDFRLVGLGLLGLELVGLAGLKIVIITFPYYVLVGYN